MTVVGLDLSLTSTGVASSSRTWRLKYRRKVEQVATPVERLARTRWLRSSILDLLAETAPTLVVVEAPAFAAVGGHEHERGGFWWSVVDVVDQAGCDLLFATPTMIKKYATGNGAADKDLVLSSTVRRFDWFAGGNDEADALWACAMGHAYLGQPLLELPQKHTDALKTWKAPLPA